MSKTVAVRGVLTGGAGWRETAGGLYCARGRRKYLTRWERLRAIEAAGKVRPDHSLYALVLAWSGARVSEVLAITPEDCHLDSSIVAIRTLKRRRPVMREVPIPPALMAMLDMHFDIRSAQANAMLSARRLFAFTRTTAWRIIKALMLDAGITGAPACPRGFRHGYGVLALHSGIPLNLLQRWLGHSRLSTTAIYADAVGPEECMMAGRLWASGVGGGGERPPLHDRQPWPDPSWRESCPSFGKAMSHSYPASCLAEKSGSYQGETHVNPGD